jgi:hypothetical protein
MFVKYEKIHRLGKEETEGILCGLCYVQEKIDGANTQIWEDDGIKLGSRNQEIKEGFNGFVEYIENHKGINKLLEDHPRYRLYGEWLVRHTVSYNETAYKKFYLFDILLDDEKFLEIPKVYELAKKYEIDTPQLFFSKENPSIEEIMDCVGKSQIGEKGEGVVIKNFGFINTFGRNDYAKVVTEKFKEENSLVFGGNNKHSDTYWEMYVVNKYCTLSRVEKIMHKIEPTIDKKLDMVHIPRITNTVYNDILTEEIWEISKKVQMLNFRSLQRLVQQKAKQIYVDILNNNLSVADKLEPKLLDKVVSDLESDN